MNKKIILSLLLVLLVAISVSAVSAETIDADIGAEDATIIADGEGGEGGDTPDPEPTYTADALEIQDKIDNAQDGDTIELDEGRTYEVGDKTYNLTKKVTIDGKGATIKASGAAQGGSGALFIANKAETVFKNIKFINTDGHKNYGEVVSGYAIQLAIANGLVDNCYFEDWSSGVYGRGAEFCTISNSNFTGSSEKVTNGGTKEYGTKAVNLMGSHDITVTGCRFIGQVLDAISIASNSGNNIMTHNYFEDNCYAIYFGGASTQGCLIANNTFINCGYCKDASGNVIFKDLPVISTQKAANGYVIADNTIVAADGSIFMKAESGNTAHGYPSLIGDINITGNTLTVAEGVIPETVTFLYIYSNEGALSPYAPINVSGNTIAAGVTPVTIWYHDWGSTTDPVIPAADSVPTSINVKEILTTDKKITIELVDVNGDVQAGKEITYSINGGETQTAETDVDGLLTIDVTEDGVVAFAFAGDDQLKATETSVNFAKTADKTTPAITANNMTVAAKIGKYYTVTLKDAAGNPLVGEKVTFYFNGKTTNVVTDENGKAKIKLTVNTKGNYQITVSYLGNNENNAVIAVKNINAIVQTTKATFAARTFKVKATKKVNFYLKDASGKAIAKKKITIKVNGKTYTATTNSKGVATVTLKITKKGKYLATAKFAGDSTYKTITKKAYMTVK